MNPHFEWFLGAACEVCDHVIVRTNLVILAEESYRHLIEVYAEKGVELVCSMPYYNSDRTDQVRGEGTFANSIEVLKQLNKVGYGRDERLVLNMVYNPAGAFFPPDQDAMEREYKARLGAEYGIVFNHLLTITNNPTGRFAAFLRRSGNLDGYMSKLYEAFNAATLPGMMCRFQVSVDYLGNVFDCDFNQAADLPIISGETVFDLAKNDYIPRQICFGNHCYACTAGQGSSCGGATQ